MHYKNGRKAEVGDLVIGMTYNKPSVQVGKVKSIRTSTNPEEVKTCNVILQLPNKTAWNVFEEDFTQCDWLLHVDDVWPFVIRMAFTSPYDQIDWFAVSQNFSSKWNSPTPELTGSNAKKTD